MACSVTAIAQPSTTDVWINEFHYDGITTFNQSDQNEFVEVIVKRTLYNNSAEFAKLKLVLYTSGAIDQTGLLDGRGLPYNESSLLFTLAETEHALTGFQVCNATSNEYVILSKSMSNLQDLPAGFALVYNNTSVVQLLSYEKVFKVAPATAGGGAAAGLTTTVILTANGDTAMETATTLNNHSISLIGAGVGYNNFRWTDALTQTATPCVENAGQTLASGAPLPVRWLDFKATGSGDKLYTQWLVNDDNNTLRYEVELKGGNYNSYTKIATVSRQSSANGKYSQTLTNLEAGIYIVRVKAVEVNGAVNYSSECQVRLGKGLNSIVVYPNPVKDNNALVQFVAGETSVYTAHVTDATGRVVKQQSFGVIRSGQLSTLALDLAGLNPGTYHVRLRSNVEELSTRILISK